MFDIALVEVACDSRICYDVAHVKVGMAKLYTVRITMTKNVTLRSLKPLAAFYSTVDAYLQVRDDELKPSSSTFKRNLAAPTLFNSTVVSS